MTTQVPSAARDTPTARFSEPPTERALLGALATSGRREDVARIDRDDFTSESRRVIFDALARRLEVGEEVSVCLLVHDVRPCGPEAVAEVYGIFEEPGASVPAYCPLLRACRLRRMLHSLGACLTTHASDATREPRDLVRWLQRQVELIVAVEPR